MYFLLLPIIFMFVFASVVFTIAVLGDIVDKVETPIDGLFCVGFSYGLSVVFVLMFLAFLFQDLFSK